MDMNLSWLSDYKISYDDLHHKLIKSLKSEDNLLESSRLVALIDLLLQSNNKKFKQSISTHRRLFEEYESLKAEWLQQWNRWKENLKVNDQFDNYHEIDKKWYRVKLLHRDGDAIRIHYLNWASKFDMTISLKESRSFPAGFRVKDRKRGSTAKVKAEDDISANNNVTEEANTMIDTGTQDQEIKPEETAVAADPILTTRSGRKLLDSSATEKPISKKKRKSVAGEDEPDKNEWICGICHFLESDDGSELILCDGPCMRSYHLGCMGLTSAEVHGNGDKWLCQDCSVGQHNCFICGIRGVDNKEVFKCHANVCGKYYHHPCLNSDEGLFIVPPAIAKLRDQVQDHLNSMSDDGIVTSTLGNGVTKQDSPEKAEESMQSESSSPVGKRQKIKPLRYNDGESALPTSMDSATDSTAATTAATMTTASVNHEEIAAWASFGNFSFKCPYHYCDTCYEYYGNNGSGGLFKCIKCPRAFHINCIPPGSRYNSVCLLCPLHPEEVLPSKVKPVVDISRTEYGWLWDQMPLPDNPPAVDVLLDHHYRLPTWVREDVDSQPTDFKMLSRNDYDALPNKRKSLPYYEPEDHCNCTTACDENCMNRILNVECCDNPLSAHSGTKFRSNCNLVNQMAGAIPKNFNCGNRQLQNRDYSQYEKFREFNRGFGLRAVSDITDGALVIEYIGEVIDEKNMIERMTNQRKFSPNDHDFYIMELDNGFYVDGKIKGNYSRYINHSCDPNCELQRWIVQGTMRIGIFAIKDIKAGEALSYDYQFDTREENIFKCYCESVNCRGTMAPAKNRNQNINQYISKMQMKLLIDPTAPYTCYDCSSSSADIANKRLINDQALAALSVKDRRKLVELGRSDESKRLEAAQSIEQRLSQSYVSNYLPGDGVNEIRSGPVRSTFQSARNNKIFLPRATTQGKNFLKRSRLFRTQEYLHPDAVTYDDVPA